MKAGRGNSREPKPHGYSGGAYSRISSEIVKPIQNSSASTPLTRDASVMAFVECGTAVSGSTTKFIITYTTPP